MHAINSINHGHAYDIYELKASWYESQQCLHSLMHSCMSI